MKLAIIGLLFILLLGSFGPWPFDLDFKDQNWESRKITVLTRTAPLSYQKVGKENSGIDFDLIQNFSTVTGFKIQWKKFTSEEQLLKAFNNGEGDLIAGRININAFQEFNGLGTNFHRGPAIEESFYNLVCHRKHSIFTIADLDNHSVIYNSAQRKFLQSELFESSNAIFWQESDLSSARLISQVVKRKADCAILESYEALALMRKHPQIEVKMIVSEPITLGWIFRARDQNLQKALSTWMQISTRNGLILDTTSRYKAHLEEMNLFEFRSFWQLVYSTLPQYEKDFKAAAKKYALPWQLLAAVAYQESKWNPEAKSFTGVLGLMQITSATADFLGLEDRLDTSANIEAGAKYLRYLYDKTPKNLPYKERLSLTLAAWNVGPGHLEDAMGLAIARNLNPNSWLHLTQVLPLLSDEEIYKDLKYGAARGTEPIHFVHRVRNYYDLLSLHVN